MSAVKHTPGWRYSINYGPEGEANYANVFDASGNLVSNLKTHHAAEVVHAANCHYDLLEALKGLSAAVFVPNDERSPTLRDAIERATAAIVKAEGREASK